jgi:hypothetical protein
MDVRSQLSVVIKRHSVVMVELLPRRSYTDLGSSSKSATTHQQDSDHQYAVQESMKDNQQVGSYNTAEETRAVWQGKAGKP